MLANANTVTAETNVPTVCRFIALIVTPEGLPLAYEVMPGNTSDKTTLVDFLKNIETQYSKSERVWVMDRGSRPRRHWRRCVRAKRRFTIWSARPGEG